MPNRCTRSAKDKGDATQLLEEAREIVQNKSLMKNRVDQAIEGITSEARTFSKNYLDEHSWEFLDEFNLEGDPVYEDLKKKYLAK